MVVETERGVQAASALTALLLARFFSFPHVVYSSLGARAELGCTMEVSQLFRCAAHLYLAEPLLRALNPLDTDRQRPSGFSVQL